MKKGKVYLRAIVSLVTFVLGVFSVPPSVAAATTTACSPVPTSEGTASTTFTVTTPGTYQLWVRAYSPASGSGGIDLKIDNDCPVSVGGNALSAGTFNWLDNDAVGTTRSATVDLKRGTHTITLAGKDPSIGADEVLLTTNTACKPAGTSGECTPNSVAPTGHASSTGTPHHTSQARSTLSIVRLITIAASAAVIAALLSLILIYYYVSRLSGRFGRVSLLKRKHQMWPQGFEPASQVVTMSGVQEPESLLRRKSTIILSIGSGIICGFITLIALAAPSYHTIIIDLSHVKVSGQARVVANADALNDHMLQFGNGSKSASMPIAPAQTAATATPPESSPRTSETHTSSTGSGTSFGSSAGSSSGSSSGPSSGSSSGSGSGSGDSGSACTNPNYSSSGSESTDNTDSGDGYEYWWVNNDAWSGSAGPQTIYVCNQSSWYVVSNQTNNGGQVETYPDTEYDVGGRNNGSSKPISQWNTITGAFAEDFPATGSWDAGFDLWTNDWTNETMIWNQWEGSQDYWYQKATTTVSLDGVPYKFIANGGELIFMRENQVQSGSVDILAAWNWEVANGYASASDVPTQLEYGVEICATNGPETFPVNNVSFTVE